MTNISIIGSGSIATALGNILSAKINLNVTLLSIEDDVVDSINKSNINYKYFPNIKLNSNLKATTDNKILNSANVVFLAIPSSVTVNYILRLKNELNKNSILVNLAKGFGNEDQTIVECLEDKIPNPVCSLKGPTFARELINKSPTAFTLGARNEEVFKLFSEIFKDTNIFIDFSTDVIGVEILSILKNIYAIAVGIVDAHFNSANLRFLFLTKAFNEMKDILTEYGGREDTMFKYCGYGDFGLTALNDLSRNRTLGLLIGKGFFTDNISEKVTLEGRIAVNVFYDEMLARKVDISEYPILNELYHVFNSEYDISEFVGRLLRDNN